MKKLFICVLLTIAVTTAVSQNSTSGNTPPDEQTPAAITDKFNSEHPGVPATWKKDGDNYKVDFVDPDSNMGQIIVYDRNGSILRRESELDNLAYPQSINDYFIKTYPGEKYKTWGSQDY